MLNLLKVLVRPIHPLDETGIDAGMPSIGVEPLLIEVDQQINFSRHFVPIQQHHSRLENTMFETNGSRKQKRGYSQTITP